MMKMPDDFTVRLLDLPCNVKALVVLDEDGYPNIYVNARLSYYEQYKAVEHELRHILNDDAYNDRDIDEVERE